MLLMAERLRLKEVRAIFRLIGEIRAVGCDPDQWRAHLVRRIRHLLDAQIVISSEVHVKDVPFPIKGSTGKLRITDLGWGCDGDGEKDTWAVRSESDSRPEEFLLALMPGAEVSEVHQTVPVRPSIALRAGNSFVLSQYTLPHLGTVDQLGVHKDALSAPFTPAQHRLIRLFHVELGRLWRKDALQRARDPNLELPPRLQQTLDALRAGCSEKQVSLKLGISQHTVHNYVKALHHRLGVSSRGELLAKATAPASAFVPSFSVQQ
jgi:DNA-binding CsgD family transcriptional regulator